jgi:hypothetical protein
MPNLATELNHLREADRHIEIAGGNIRQQEELLRQGHQAGCATTEAETALKAAVEGLIEFKRHRALIVATIEDIQAGRLPST